MNTPEKAVKVGWCLRICGMDHDIAGIELPDRYMKRRAYNVIDLARRFAPDARQQEPK